MGLSEKIKKWESKLNISKGRYKFNKLVFNIMILLMLLIVFFVWAEYDFENIKKPHIYLACNEPNLVCENEFYDLCNPNSHEFVAYQDVCNDLEPELYANEFLRKGDSVGHKPSWLAKNTSDLFFYLLCLAILLNHFLFNKGFKFKKLELE